ncbi:MAG: hypothetical protein R2855_10370 [Thermomicrobiales bacterium]
MEQQLELHIGCRLPQAKCNVRISIAENAKQVGQIAVNSGRYEPNCQGSLDASSEAQSASRERLRVFHECPRMSQQIRSCWGQYHMPVGPLEQLNPQFDLEFLNGLGQRRLMHPEPRSGSPKVQLLPQCDELLQLSKTEPASEVLAHMETISNYWGSYISHHLDYQIGSTARVGCLARMSMAQSLC